jgi:hypothetical protein
VSEPDKITCKWCSVPKTEEEYFPSFLRMNYHVCRQCQIDRNTTRRRDKGVKERVYRTTQERKDLKRQYDETYNREHREQIAHSGRKRLYGITAEEYERKLADQGGVCAACRQPETRKAPKSKTIAPLHVDHDHATGQVRGLLCHRCNMALGYAREDPDVLRSLATYVEFYQVV